MELRNVNSVFGAWGDVLLCSIPVLVNDVDPMDSLARYIKPLDDVPAVWFPSSVMVPIVMEYGFNVNEYPEYMTGANIDFGSEFNAVQIITSKGHFINAFFMYNKWQLVLHDLLRTPRFVWVNHIDATHEIKLIHRALGGELYADIDPNNIVECVIKYVETTRNNSAAIYQLSIKEVLEWLKEPSGNRPKATQVWSPTVKKVTFRNLIDPDRV